MASGGYPGAFEAGKLISGIDEADAHLWSEGLPCRHQSPRWRLLHVRRPRAGCDRARKDLPEAVERAYDAVMKIRFDGMHYRKDIAARGLKHLRAGK